MEFGEQMEVFKKDLLERNKKDRTTTIIASLIGVTLVVLLFLFFYK